ncbi:hypothetical protein EDD85DRAFT_543942 [Armillaria nabsnona]|nr:hypothetical protein EDD85DRAFT_543942 [Armillaria nabsnona]
MYMVLSFLKVACIVGLVAGKDRSARQGVSPPIPISTPALLSVNRRLDIFGLPSAISYVLRFLHLAGVRFDCARC